MSLQSIPGSDAESEIEALGQDPLGHLSRCFREHGPIFKTNLGSPVVFLVGPEANKCMLSTHRHIFGNKEGYDAGPIGQLFAGSLLSQPDGPAAQDRAVLQAGLGRMAMAQNVQHIHDMWTARLSGLDDGQSHDLHEVCARVGLEAAMVVQLGLEPEDAQFERFHPLVQTLMEGARPSCEEETFQAALEAREALIARLIPLIERARQGPAKGVVGALAQQVGPDGSQMNAQKIAENLLLLLWAGYDTFSATASWTFHHLAQAPLWQQRLRTRQQQVFANNPAFTMEALAQLEEHGWVIKEVERLCPIGIFFARVLTEDFTFQGHFLPKDTIACYSAYLTHRMPELFPDPDAFLPERWDPALGDKAAPSSALVGFGAGPRVCLGKPFAQMQLRIILCTVLNRYRVELDPDRPMTQVPLSVNHPEDAYAYFRSSPLSR